MNAAGEAQWSNLTPEQASRVESGDRRGSMKARAGGCVSNAQDLLAKAVALSHPKAVYEALMFYIASDNHWWSFLMQAPKAELEGGVEVEKMSHEPLGFQSGTFRGLQQR